MLQNVYAYLHSAWCHELQKLREVAKNCEKDALCGSDDSSSLNLSPIKMACATSH